MAVDEERMMALEQEVESLREELGEMRTALQGAAAALNISQWPAVDRT